MTVNRKVISHFVRKAYLTYFDLKIGDQDKGWAPHIVCRICTESLWHWTCGKRRSLRSQPKLLASRLKEKNRNIEKDLLPFFCQKNNLVFCNEGRELIINMGVEEYSHIDWRLFIDSSKRSLKCVLLNNSNKYESIPIAHSIKIKKEYETVAFILTMQNIIVKFVLTWKWLTFS